MAFYQFKALVDFKDIDGDRWRIKWYPTYDRDLNKEYWFGIEDIEHNGDDFVHCASNYAYAATRQSPCTDS